MRYPFLTGLALGMFIGWMGHAFSASFIPARTQPHLSWERLTELMEARN